MVTGLGEHLAESQVDITTTYSTQYTRAHLDIPSIKDSEPIDKSISFCGNFRVPKEVECLKWSGY